MGVVKRIQGWRDSRWPIPNTLQALVGLIEPRDPEAYLEAKRAARETDGSMVLQVHGPSGPSSQEPRTNDQGLSDGIDLEIDPGEYKVGDDLPSRAAPGWYRFGRTFYRISQGPFQHWGFPEPARAAATVQGRLF
jgi:hypothetical protein